MGRYLCCRQATPRIPRKTRTNHNDHAATARRSRSRLMSSRRERGPSNAATENPAQTAVTVPTGGLNLSELKEKTIPELSGIAREMNVQNASGLRKQELIFKILQAQAEKDGLIYGEGVLEVL